MRAKFDAAAALQTPRLSDHDMVAPPTALRLIVREDLAAYRSRTCATAYGGEPLIPSDSRREARNRTTIYEGYADGERG